MWWRIITFCVLVSCVLVIVLSCIHGRPVLQLFFHRCCEDDIENDQVIFQNFDNNFLRERLIGDDNFITDNMSLVSNEEIQEVLAILKEKLNVHDPNSRINLKDGTKTTNIEYCKDSVKVTTEMNKKLHETSDVTESEENILGDVSEENKLGDISESEDMEATERGITKSVPKEFDSEESGEVTTERVERKTSDVIIK